MLNSDKELRDLLSTREEDALFIAKLMRAYAEIVKKFSEHKVSVVLDSSNSLHIKFVVIIRPKFTITQEVHKEILEEAHWIIEHYYLTNYVAVIVYRSPESVTTDETKSIETKNEEKTNDIEP